MVKIPPAIQEMWIRSLVQEDPLENRIAIHSSFLAWENPWIEELKKLQSTGSQKSQTQLSNYNNQYLIYCGLVTKLCSTLCDPMNCSPPGCSVHGIFQERILEWVAISFSNLIYNLILYIKCIYLNIYY